MEKASEMNVKGENCQHEFRILHLAKRVPMKNSSHAGGKISYYYLSYVAEKLPCDLIAIRQPTEQVGEAPNVKSKRFITAPIDVRDATDVRGLIERFVAYGCMLLCALKQMRRKKYDLIVLEWPAIGFLGPFLRYLGRVEYVIIVHDLWSDRLSTDIKYSHTVKKLMLGAIKMLIEKLEKWSQEKAAGLVCFDYRTAELLVQSTGKNPLVLPPFYEVWQRFAEEPGTIAFYGDMSRFVNWKSAVWFIENVLPKVVAQKPYIKFYVIGANPPPQLQKYHDGKNVVVTGWLDNPATILGRCQIFVAPLLSGAGIKIKVIEAMAAGLPVVANAVAMQGIPATPGEHYYHAETPDEFALAIVTLMEDEQLRKRFSEKAVQLIQDVFCLERAGDKLISLYYEVMKTKCNNSNSLA